MSFWFFLFWSSPLQLLSLRFYNPINILLISFVLVLSVSVCGRVGEIALPAEARKVSTLRIFPFSTSFAFFLHILNEATYEYNNSFS